MSPVKNTMTREMAETLFFPICSVDVFCFSLACFLLKVSEIFSCMNFIDFTHCSQASEGDAETLCTVSARKSEETLLPCEWE